MHAVVLSSYASWVVLWTVFELDNLCGVLCRSNLEHKINLVAEGKKTKEEVLREALTQAQFDYRAARMRISKPFNRFHVLGCLYSTRHRLDIHNTIKCAKVFTK